MNKIIKGGIFFITLLFLTVGAHAQLNNCNTFLKSNYLEVGVNWNGAYGTAGAPPTGYHPDTLSSFYDCEGVKNTVSALGFVADVDKDGWSTGTPPYYGDYILPGAHQEGWSLLANGIQINEWNSLSDDSAQLEGGMLLYDTSYMTGPTGDTSIWEGYYASSITIYQMTVLDTGKLFFTVYLQIVNSGISSGDYYYMRTIKPENDALLPGGGYITKNKIEYTLPGDALNRSVVSSASTLYPKAYVALGTRNPNASSFIITDAASPIYSTIDNITPGGDPDYLYAANDSLTNTGGIGIIFSLGSPEPLIADTFSFVYAFSPAALREALGLPSDTTTTDTTISHVGVNNINAVHYTVYPNPTKNTFSITGLINTDHLCLYDELGRNVSGNLTGNGKNIFNTGDLPAGLYILLVKDAAGAVKWKTPLQKQ